jgi:AcrR family transcriptional regulator
MKSGSREKRRNEILDIAVEILSEKGYREASMLEVAKRASASKETLYAWFGDKRGLFEAVIQRNALEVQTTMSRHLEANAPMEQGLAEFGRALLSLLLGESAVAINRAAITEAKSDPKLAQTLAKVGREATLPYFIRFLEHHRETRALEIGDPRQAAEEYLGLLLGDIQIRRLLGIMEAPKKAAIEARVNRAGESFLKIYTV